jgi:RNA polymerase sigma-70 factor (ECF subfamily)
VNEQASETTTDPGLLDRCRAGDSLAFEELFDEHFAFVRRVARNLGTPASELDDVVQEAFVVAFRRLDQFHEGRFTTWLYRITSHLVANRHRSRNVREAFGALFGREPTLHVTPPDAEVERKQAHATVAALLAGIGHKKREVFALYELEGLSGEEIAERLQCPVDTVWSRLHYARRDFERLARKRGLK